MSETPTTLCIRLMETIFYKTEGSVRYMLKVHTATKFSLNALCNDARVFYKNPLGGGCGNQRRKEPNYNHYSIVKTVKRTRGLSV